jgi:hypothetical protein
MEVFKFFYFLIIKRRMYMKRNFFSMILVFVMILGLAPSSVLAAPATAESYHGDKGRGLVPGETVTFEQNVPINIVFLGYDQKTINKKAILDQLPSTYSPIVRYPAFYSLPGRDMGLKFDFKYDLSFASSKTTDAFFKYVKMIGVPSALTLFQQYYNDMENNVLDVPDTVLYVDAPSVEDWLNKNVTDKRANGYTIVFVNWYSRPDFKFHVYTKTDVVDPDTGYNFGQNRSSRKMIAWGGSNSRLWFYDLSAGPESWAGSYDVDNVDLSADDYRMPPIWEYTRHGYRNPSALSSDLGLVTRYVGIDLLFTTSPLYDPMVTAPEVNGDKVVHVNMMEDDVPASQGTDWINTSFIQKQLRKFEPYYDWQVNLTDINPIDDGAKNAFRIWSGVTSLDDCWDDYGDPFAELFCYFDTNRDTYIPAYTDADYVAPIHAFNTTVGNMGGYSNLLGFSDDNWVDGTQSYVFAFDTEDYRSLGYGFSTTVVHEGGHHFGMSHPHDGYDSESGQDFDATGDYYFANSGDESNTIMSYIDLSDEFGQFDQDNMYRWEMAGYLNWSNELAAQILAAPKSHSVQKYLASAENYAQQARSSFNRWNYLDAARSARSAYEQLSLAANKLGIPTPSMNQLMALRMAPSQNAPHEGDPIRFPDN